MTLEVLSSRVLLRPVDPERSIRFYRDTLGLAVFREFGEPPHYGIVFFTGNGLLEVSGRSAEPPAGNIELWFQVRDVDRAHRELDAAGVPVLQAPRTEPWGLREMWIADPDGIQIAVVEVPADHPLRRR